LPILGNFCIVSPRKYGKTGLILHTFAEMKRRRLNYETLYVDIFATLTLEDFTKTLAEAILIKFPEKTAEALLRTYTQSMQNIRFIFCGSKKKLMAEMFTSAGRPFFSSTMKNAANRILERESDYFLQYRELLTRQQWLLLVAVAKEGSVSKLTSTVFLKKYNIDTRTLAVRQNPCKKRNCC
jgi:hypothetical protein